MTSDPAGLFRDQQAKKSKTTPCTVAGDAGPCFRVLRNILMRRANHRYIAIIAQPRHHAQTTVSRWRREAVLPSLRNGRSPLRAREQQRESCCSALENSGASLLTGSAMERAGAVALTLQSATTRANRWAFTTVGRSSSVLPRQTCTHRWLPR